jgi:hypothetical protein
VRPALTWAALALLAADGCVLPSYDKLSASEAAARTSDAGARPDDGLAGGSDECNACIAASCGEQLRSCGPDCEGITLPINPATAVPEEADNMAFTPFVGCVLTNCDACNLRWGCVNQYLWPAAKDPYTVTARMIDIASSAAVTDVSVLACQGADPSCSPSSGLISTGETNAMGRATLAVTRDFNGWFQFKGADTYMPASAVFTQPTYNVRETFTQRMIAWPVAEGLAMATGVKLNRDLAHMIFRASNCLPLRYMGSEGIVNAEAEGVQVTFTPPTSESSMVFYTGENASLDPTLDSTTVPGGAFGGVFNLPLTLVTVIAKYQGMEVARTALQIRPGTVGWVYLIPKPR